MVQFCNVNSCQFLKYIFYKDHFLASNELGNWPPIRIKFFTISQKQNKTEHLKKTKKQNKTKPHQPTGVKIAQLHLKENYTIYRQVHTGIVSESMKHSCSNISSVLSQFSWKENWYVILFFMDMKKEARRQSWENRRYPKGSGGIWLFWSLYQQLPHPQTIQFLPTTRFSLPSGLERWTRLLQQQGPKKHPKYKYWQNHKGSILIPSKTSSLKKECVQLLALD